MFPGNANPLIGAWQNANQEMGVPRFAPMQFMPTVLWDFETIPIVSPCRDAPFGHWGGAVPFLWWERQVSASSRRWSYEAMKESFDEAMMRLPSALKAPELTSPGQRPG